VQKCKATVEKDGESRQCQAWCLKGEDYCLFHSNSERAKTVRKKKILSNEKLILILQKQLRQLQKKKDSSMHRIGLISSIIKLILELKNEGKIPVEQNSKNSFEEKIKEWKNQT